MLPGEIITEIFSFLDNINKIALIKIIGIKNVTSEIIDNTIFDYFPTINGKGDYFLGLKKYKPFTSIKKISTNLINISYKLSIYNQIDTVYITSTEQVIPEIDVKNVVFLSHETITYNLSDKNEKIKSKNDIIMILKKNINYKLKSFKSENGYVNMHLDGLNPSDFTLIPQIEKICGMWHQHGTKLPKNIRKLKILCHIDDDIISDSITSLDIKYSIGTDSMKIISKSLKELSIPELYDNMDTPNLEKLTIKIPCDKLNLANKKFPKLKEICMTKILTCKN